MRPGESRQPARGRQLHGAARRGRGVRSPPPIASLCDLEARASTAVQKVVADEIMKMPVEKLRVVISDVGGGFGTKYFVYREYPLLLDARAGSIARWSGRADRSEHFVGDTHGRDNVTVAEMAIDEEGRFLALRRRHSAQSRRLSVAVHPFCPLAGRDDGDRRLRYRRALCPRARRLYPYGARRRLSRRRAARGGLCARAPGRPVRAHRRAHAGGDPLAKFRPAFADALQDGDRPHLRRRRFRRRARACLTKADYAGFAGRAAQSRSRGLIRGVGLSSYIECTAFGTKARRVPSCWKRRATSPSSSARSRTGQGHETAYAQVVSQYLDVPLDAGKGRAGRHGSRRHRRRHGRFAIDPRRRGHGRPRDPQTLAASLKDLAADKLEAARR